jgi:uncharacterized protein (DUF2141 family)
MRKKWSTLFLLILLTAQFPVLLAQGTLSELRIIITHVSPETGQLIIDLYDDPVAYQKEKPTQRIVLTKKEGQREYHSLVKLIRGTYAIAVFDDKNFNHTIDRNFIGYPLEGFGFYGLENLPLKKPYFKAISFELEEETKRVFIKMQYR